jgi:hypothetical protein
MSIENKIYTALQSLVGGRAYPIIAPANTQRPFIVFSKNSTAGIYTLLRATQVSHVQYEVNIFDDDVKPLADLETISKAARIALENIGASLVDEASDRDEATRLRRTRLSLSQYVRN